MESKDKELAIDSPQHVQFSNPFTVPHTTFTHSPPISYDSSPFLQSTSSYPMSYNQELSPLGQHHLQPGHQFQYNRNLTYDENRNTRAAVSKPGFPLATERQTENQIDLFYVDNTGRVNVMWVVGTGPWQGPVPLTAPGYIDELTPWTNLATERQTGNQIDLFFVDNQGRVNVMWVVGTGPWQGPVPLTAPNSTHPWAYLATERQTSNQIDLFFVDKQGRINVMWVVGTGPWQGPVPLTAPDTAAAGQDITTERQTANQIDLFFVDTQGRVNVMWVVGTGPWQGPVPLTPPGYVHPGVTSVAAERQTANQIDLFFVDKQGRINVMWVVGTGPWQGPVPLTAPGYANPWTELATERQTGNQIDLFFVDNQGRVNVMWVVGTGPWQGPVPLTAPGHVPIWAHLATERQTANQIDLFFVDKQGRVNVMWVEGTQPWHPPITL